MDPPGSCSKSKLSTTTVSSVNSQLHSLVTSSDSRVDSLRPQPAGGLPAGVDRGSLLVYVAAMSTPELRPNEDVGKPRDAAGWYDRGRQAERDGDLEVAREAYGRALARDQDQPHWHYRLGCVHLKAGDPTQATICFSAALRAEPHHGTYLPNLGAALDRLGRRDEAIRMYRKAILHETATAATYHNLGALFAEAGQTDEAIRAFSAAIDLAPDAEGYQNLGLVHFTGSDFGRAQACFEQAIACDADFAIGHYYAGLCAMKSGRYDEALKRFERVLQLNPQFARVHHNTGVCLHKLERYEKALDALQRALEAFPEDGRAHYQLALTYDALGLTQEARHHYGQSRAHQQSADGPSVTR